MAGDGTVMFNSNSSHGADIFAVPSWYVSSDHNTLCDKSAAFTVIHQTAVACGSARHVSLAQSAMQCSP